MTTAKLSKIALLILGAVLQFQMPVAASDFSGFPEPRQNFNAHIKDVKNYLLRTQMSQRNAADVEYNLPFEINANPDVRYRGKFLLIHGLNDSPYVWYDTARSLAQRGYDVRAILLPGHGNSPAAQLKISYSQWLGHARTQFDIYKSDTSLGRPAVVPVHIGGFSLGGVIATILALENPDIAGLLLFSPAYKSTMNHLLRWSSIYSKFKPWVFGGMIIEDNPSKYNSIPINGAAQYYNTTRFLSKLWKRRTLSMPVLMVITEQDSVVDIDYSQSIFNERFSTSEKILIYYDDTAALMPESTGKKSVETVVESSMDLIGTRATATAKDSGLDVQSLVLRSSYFPDRRILNQSHLSLMNSPGNPMYGENGIQLICNGNDWPTFSGCLYSTQKHWFGAQHTPSPDGIPVARTTYNPDYAFIWQQFDRLFK